MFILIINFCNNASNAKSYLPKSINIFPLLFYASIYFGSNLMHYSYLIRMFILIINFYNASNARSYLPNFSKVIPLLFHTPISFGSNLMHYSYLIRKININNKFLKTLLMLDHNCLIHLRQFLFHFMHQCN